MPIDVTCDCGKAFKVRDEFAGQAVPCQVCGRQVRAGRPQPAAFTPALPSPLRGAESNGARPAVEVRPADAELMPCPECAEQIPVASLRCPFCKEKITRKASPAEQKQALENMLRALDHSTSPTEEELRLKGGFLSAKTIVLLVCVGLGAALFFGGLLSGSRDGEVAVVFGVIVGLGFGIPAIVSLVNDYHCGHIQDAPSADAAVRRFFIAVRTSRSAKAYAALHPDARRAGEVETIKFTNPKIPAHQKQYAINDLKSFQEYWKGVFQGPSPQNRTVALKRARVVRQLQDGAVVEMEVEITNYNSLLLLLILINILICALVIYAVQAREKQTIRKLVVQRGGRWYIAEGAYQGPLDAFDI